MENREEKHIKKMIAPIVITGIIMLYLVLYITALLTIRLPFSVRLGGLVLLLILAGVAVGMLVERIKEIRSGEEDDLSQY